MTNETSEGGLMSLLSATRAGRNFAFGLVVGAVITAGIYYAQVISPDETVADASYYLVLGVVLGLSIALLLAIVLSVITLYRRGQNVTTH